MAIGSIQFTTIARTHDVVQHKLQEDGKGMQVQNQLGHEKQKTIQEQQKKVSDTKEGEWHNRKFDAKDKGSNAYGGDGGRRRREKDGDGQGGQPRFDQKV